MLVQVKQDCDSDGEPACLAKIRFPETIAEKLN